MPIESVDDTNTIFRIIANEDEHALPFVFMLIFGGGIGTPFKIKEHTGLLWRDFFELNEEEKQDAQVLYQSIVNTGRDITFNTNRLNQPQDLALLTCMFGNDSVGLKNLLN